VQPPQQAVERRTPLREEEELRQAMGERPRPILPVRRGNVPAQRGEKCVVVEPGGLAAAEAGKLARKLRESARLKAAPGKCDGFLFQSQGFVVVQAALGKRAGGQVGFFQQALAMQIVEADKRRIAGVRGVC